MGTFQVKYADDGDDCWEYASDDYLDDEAAEVAEDFVERQHQRLRPHDSTEEQFSVLVDVLRLTDGEVSRFRVSIALVWRFTANPANPPPPPSPPETALRSST